MDTQIKSKDRVAAHGEVFTNPREVNAMLDLVKAETERIDSRFLEPACGDGNFLIEILRRKLAVCEDRVKAKKYTQLQYEHDAIWAISSIYGIELLEDNAKACRERLLGYFTEQYTRLFKSKCKAACIESASYILSKNIIHGDAKSVSIAAASIIAKVTRDRIMVEYDSLFPEYGFARHKGYGTADHYAALKKYGPCPIHRRSFLSFTEHGETARK